ncbi:MAG: spermidine synthase, partial [Gemmatimonadales bacterium]
LFGRSFSVLYGLNTAGAVLGVLLSGLIILGEFGERATVATGVVINLTVGLIALMLARSGGPTESEGLPEARPASAAPMISPYPAAVRTFVLVAFAMSGFTALAYEIIWTRQLIIFLKTSIYAFSGMLAVFLCGIALGSLAIGRVVDRLRSPLVVFGVLELGVAAVSVVNLYLFVPLDSNFAARLLGLSSVFYATIALVLPLTLMFGMIAPLAAVCYTHTAERSGSSVGRLYGGNTLGSILGSLVAGFLLVPSLGATHSVMVLALINLLLGLTLVSLEANGSTIRRRAFWGVAAIVLALGYRTRDRDPFRAAIERRIVDRVGTTWMPDSNLALPKSEKILFHREGLEATVTAFEVNRFKQLWVNGVGMAFLTTATKLIAHLPMQVADQPKEFLAIAFGMGNTVRSALRYPELNVTTVDLVPETFETLKYYHTDADRVLANPRLHTVVNDGRNFLLLSPKLFDVITVDPPPPIWSAGTVNLYAREFMALARSRLTPNGVFCLWFPGGTEQEVKGLIRTFHDVFPEGTVWSGPHGWGYYLVGTLRPLDLARFREQARRTYADSALTSDLTEFDRPVDTPEKLESLLMWQADELDSLTRGAPLITDNYPFTEFPLWRYLLHGSRLWHPRSVWLNPAKRTQTQAASALYRDQPDPAGN